MPLHDAVGITVKRAQLLNIKAQMTSIRAKGSMSDLTSLPPPLGGERKSCILLWLR